MKKDKEQLNIDEFRVEKPKRVISFEENEKFKAAFDSDHPDFVDPDFIDVTEIIKAEEKPVEVIDTTQNPMYFGKTKEDWWESKKRVYPKSATSSENFKKFINRENSKLIHNPILGYVLPEVEREAIERGAIVKKTFQNLTYFCIPVETVTIDNGKGKVKEGIITSQAYTDFMDELKNKKVKISKSTLI